MASPVLSFIALANRAMLDSLSGRISLIDFFDVVLIPTGRDDIILSFDAVVRINDVKSGKSKTVVSIQDPDNTTIAEATIEGQFEAGVVQFIAHFQMVKVSKIGRHVLKVYHNKEKLDDEKRYFFEVKQQ